MINLAAAYIDEAGTHDEAPILCAGGYIFEAGAAATLNAEMGALFAEKGIDYFHASEILAGQFKEGGTGHFDHLTADDRDVLARKFIASIKQHSAYGFAATVREADYNRLIRPYSVMPSAYAFLIFQCLILVRRHIERTGFPGDVFFFIEDGAKEKRDAIHYLDNDVLNTPEKRARYRYHDRAFVGKRHSPAINAADLLIYRWYSHHANSSRPGYKPRKDLIALLRPQDNVMDYADDDLDRLQGVVSSWVAEHAPRLLPGRD